MVMVSPAANVTDALFWLGGQPEKNAALRAPLPVPLPVLRLGLEGGGAGLTVIRGRSIGLSSSPKMPPKGDRRTGSGA